MHVRRLHRRASLIVLGVVALTLSVVVSGCDLMIAPVTPRPSRLVATPEPRPDPTPTELDEAPTIRPEPSDDGPDLVDAANRLADLDSYRVSVACRGLVPATTANGLVTMTSTLIQTGDPAAEFTMTGVDGFNDGRLQAIVIGEEAWLREGSAGWEKSPGGAADFDAAFTTLSPIDLATGFEGLSPALTAVGDERRNGQPSTHYRVTDKDPLAAAAGLTDGTADVWLALDGGHLVRLAIDGTWDIDGSPTPVSLTIDVSHVDDPANRVAAPG